MDESEESLVVFPGHLLKDNCVHVRPSRSLNCTCFVSRGFTKDWLSFCLWSNRCSGWRGYRPQACPSAHTHHPSWSRPSGSSGHCFDRRGDPQNLPVVKPEPKGEKNTIKNGKFCDIAQHYDPCDVLTLHASSRPRVSPAHSILEVTVRPDSTSGTQRSLGHRRTWPLLTRSEYSAETGDSNYVK